MGKFNIKRFWLTLKWFFFENRGQIIKWMLGIMLATTLLQMGLVGINTHTTTRVEGMPQDLTPYQMAVTVVNTICTFIVVLAVLFVNSNVFGMLKTKQKRIAFLTLPATNLERWTVAILFAVVLVPAFIVVGYFLGDVLRNIVYAIQGHEWVWGFNIFFSKTSPQGENGFVAKLLQYAIILWSISLYVLAGTWFRKGQFIIATFFQILITALLDYLANTFKNEILEILVNGISAGQENLMAYGIIAVITALVLFHFWLSYRIFTRYQIITSKWSNI